MEAFINGISRVWNQPFPKFAEATDCALVIFIYEVFWHCSLLMFPFTTWENLKTWYPASVDHLVFETIALVATLLIGISNCFRYWGLPIFWLIQVWFYECYMIYVLFGVMKPWSNGYLGFRIFEHCLRLFTNFWFALILRVYATELYAESEFIRKVRAERANVIQTKVALRRKQFVLPYAHNQRPKFGFGIKLAHLQLLDPEYLKEKAKPRKPEPLPLIFEPAASVF